MIGKSPLCAARHLLVLAILLATARVTPVLGDSPSDVASGSSAVAPSPVLSTPELIEQAFAAAEIAPETRLLYLAYAIYDYNSLPVRFQSDVPWFGTQVVQELATILHDAQAHTIPPLSPEVQAEFERLAPQAATVCDQQDGANSKESTNFHLNYGTIAGGLTDQKYVDSLETAYATEVTSYGWPKPPYCTAGTGNCTNTNPWTRYPVQAASLGGGLYGYVVYPGGSYTGQVNDNPNTTATETVARASCMVLNRDYSGFPGGAQKALDVTTAHEFNHAIQYGTGDPGKMEDLVWYEGSAAYIEDEVHDAVNDNYQYLWPTFDRCLGQYPGDGYSGWLFFRYAAEHNGGTNAAGGGEDVAQAFWANVAAGQSGLGAFGSALTAEGTNLNDTFHKYAIASRFNKACPSATPYCYEEAAGYVTSAGAATNHGTIATIGGSYDGSLEDHYALNWIGLPGQGIYSITLENKSAGGEFRASIVADTGTALQVTAMPAVAGGNDRTTLDEYEPPDGATSVVAVITNQKKTSDDPAACTANPYRLSTAPPVALVIDDTGSMSEEIGDVKTTVSQKVDEFVARGLYPNYHLLTYKDDVTYRGATADPATIKTWVNALSADGGGDCPEEMLGALDRIAVEAPHSEAWVMTDAGFHGGLGNLLATIYHLVQAHVNVHPIIYSWCTTEDVGCSNDGTPVSEVGAALQLGEESAAQLARETGGHYFHIASSETQDAAAILLNEMVAVSDLKLTTGQVTSGTPKTYDVQVDGTTKTLNLLLNGFGGYSSMQVFDPNNTLVAPGDPAVTYTSISNAQYYQVEGPMPGVWHITVSGDGDFDFSSSADSAVTFEYLSDTTWTLDEPTTLLASLAGPVNSAAFDLTNPDGTVAGSLDMYDDGLHGDGAAGDGLFGTVHTPVVTGTFYLAVDGLVKTGTAFERVATEAIRVYTLQVTASAGRVVPAGGTTVYDFWITNGGGGGDTFDVTVTSSQGWADLSGVPPSVTIAAGETAQVSVPINVPGGAAAGAVDETVLVAVSQTTLANDVASVLTTVSTVAKIYLPTVTKKSGTPVGFDSQFNGSASRWESHSGTWTVDSDSYSTPGLAGSSSSASYAADFADLDYQARLWRSGCDTCANRLLIRGNPTPLSSDNYWYDVYLFQYSGDGQFSVWKQVAGVTSQMKAWTASSAINQGDAWNTLRVVAVDSSFSFYINGTLVWTGSDTSLTSGRVGVGMYRSSTSSGDLFDVDWATLSVVSGSMAGTSLPGGQVSAEQQALNQAAKEPAGGDVNVAPAEKR